MIDVNALGERGEIIAHVALSTFHGNGPLFKLRHLGEKWPITDYLGEVVGQPGHVFLFQVKCTQQTPLPGPPPSLPVSIDPIRLQLLQSAVLPAYLVAVHDPTRGVFIGAPLNHQTSAVPMVHSLDDPLVRMQLRNEVSAFWIGVQQPFMPATSLFGY